MVNRELMLPLFADSQSSMSPALGHCSMCPSSTSHSNFFSSLWSLTKCCYNSQFFLVLYSLSIWIRVKSATRGVLSCLESTKVVFVFGGGSVLDPTGGVYDTTLDPSRPGRVVLFPALRPIDVFCASVSASCFIPFAPSPGDATALCSCFIMWTDTCTAS